MTDMTPNEARMPEDAAVTVTKPILFGPWRVRFV